MTRSEYYQAMKALAGETRVRFDLETTDTSLTRLNQIYKAEGIKITYWDRPFRKVRGAYLIIDDEPHVLINARITPKEPRIFSLCHELKHHFVDQELATSGIGCQLVSWNDGSPIEIGAEIFAAELIFPEAEFIALCRRLRIGDDCAKEDVVRLKRACPAPVSYTFLRKRLEWFGLASPGQFSGVQFQKLEEQIHGVPFWKQQYLRSRRSGRSA